MRLIEKCACGASIELIWSEPLGTYDYQTLRESERATKELALFRSAHAHGTGYNLASAVPGDETR